ncbi:uncharacterized protein LOC105255426 isoform X1 [Camponotus floridanus]|uniref:uncharacterized protein LOC105255426 isoform X1 n=1 Tax=Camponotus floridanus TaxID=104421 RepID=UPI000DC6B8BF|nr:uncharacterized protein LOC105255426 isoform X1 [Camponotus floridanus]
MKRIYFIILLTICTCNVLLGSKKCFKFTWVGQSINQKDCSDHEIFPENIPCIAPIYNDTTLNTTKIWEDTKKKNHENQPVTDCDLACIKYTYIYNGRVINASHFCGKVIEDQTIAVTTGCYVTHTEGYAIEMCACEPEDKDKEPCNSAIRNTYSITFMAVVSLFICKIFNIP